MYCGIVIRSYCKSGRPLKCELLTHTHTPIHIHTHTHKVCNSKATQKGVLGPIKTCWWSSSCKWNVMKCCCLLLSWFSSSHCDLRLYETTTATDKSILFFPSRCLCMCVKRQCQRVYYVQNIKNRFQIQGWVIWSETSEIWKVYNRTKLDCSLHNTVHVSAPIKLRFNPLNCSIQITDHTTWPYNSLIPIITHVLILLERQMASHSQCYQPQLTPTAPTITHYPLITMTHKCIQRSPLGSEMVHCTIIQITAEHGCNCWNWVIMEEVGGGSKCHKLSN